MAENDINSIAADMSECSLADEELFATHLLELSRTTEEIKANLCQDLMNRYDTFEIYDINSAHFNMQLLKLKETFHKMTDGLKLLNRRKTLGVEGRSVTVEGKLCRIKLLHSCCDWLLLMVDELEATKVNNRSDSFGDAVESYQKFKALGDKIFDSFPSDQKAHKEFPIVEIMDRQNNKTMADLVVRMKRIFLSNINWKKDCSETKLIIRHSEVMSPEQWTEVLESMDKIGRLEELVSELHADLMTHFVRPIMNSSYSEVNVSGHELTFRVDPLRTEGKVKPLVERIFTLVTLVEFLYRRLRSPSEECESRFSLFERLGSNGRGRSLLKFLVSFLGPRGAGDIRALSRERQTSVETFEHLLNDLKERKFVSGLEAEELEIALRSLKSEPGLYVSILARAQGLVRSNLHFAVKVGCRVKGEWGEEEEEEDEDVGEGGDARAGVEGSAASSLLSPYVSVHEAFNNLLPDDMKFNECCVSLPGSRIVDLFYEALEVKVADSGQPLSDASIRDFTMGMTLSDMTLSDTPQNASCSLSLSVADSFVCSSVGGETRRKKQTKGEPVMRKDSEEDLVRTHRCIRSVAELFEAAVPAIHREDIEGDPLTAALHHNDCLYVAHHLMALEHHMRPKVKAKKTKKGPQPNPMNRPELPLALTTFDLQCNLRKLACRSFISFLTRRREELDGLMTSAFKKKDCDRTASDHYKRILDALGEARGRILRLKKIWSGILQKNTLHNSLGCLLNKVIQSTSECFFRMASEFVPSRKTIQPKHYGEADTACTSPGDAEFLLSFMRACFESISQTAAGLFPSTGSGKISAKNVSSWKKLQELRFITEPFVSSHRVLARWCLKRDQKTDAPPSVNKAVVGEILAPSEVRAFLCLAFNDRGTELEKLMKIFK